MCYSLKVMPLYFKAFYNSSELLLKNIVLYLRIGKALRVVGNRVLVLLY
jgi:hypothetical protein